MRIQVILGSSFARPGSAPIWGGKKGVFRDWNKYNGEGKLLNLSSLDIWVRNFVVTSFAKKNIFWYRL